MPSLLVEDFDYGGFLQECEEAIIRYGYSNYLIALESGIDPATLRTAIKLRTYGFRTAVALSKVLNVSIDKYVRAL